RQCGGNRWDLGRTERELSWHVKCLKHLPVGRILRMRILASSSKIYGRKIWDRKIRMNGIEAEKWGQKDEEKEGIEKGCQAERCGGRKMRQNGGSVAHATDGTLWALDRTGRASGGLREKA